jgi:hypothetical protein
MPKRDIHHQYDFFEYVRINGEVPPESADRIDVALLDMNHSWPNVGHDSIVHSVLEAAEPMRDELVDAGLKVRVLSYDVRRTLRLPEAPNGRFQIYVGTGGPGHLDPRLNDGVSDFSQGISESVSWEEPLFSLYESIANHPTASLFGICHSFGLMCRWSGVASPQLREEKSSGMPENVLTGRGMEHPWFSNFSRELNDGRHFRVIDNRLFDLFPEQTSGVEVIAHETESEKALTVVEFAHMPGTRMPRILGVNHHPEIIDREHIMTVLDEKRAHGEVSDAWYREREETLNEMLDDEAERQSRLTSHYTFIGPLRFHLDRLIEERCADLAPAAQSVARQ